MTGWEQLYNTCMNCTRCGLCQTRNHVVFGVGPADADVMFRGDVAGLWKLRDEQVSILPSHDSPLPGHNWNQEAVDWYSGHGLHLEHPEEYFCAGLSLVNLRRLREIGWQRLRDAFLSDYEPNQMPNADQCVLNWILRDDKCLLPREWGAFSGDANVDLDWDSPCAVHFVDDAPWARGKPTHLMSDLAIEWWSLAESLQDGRENVSEGFRGCKNWLDYAWRRTAFVALKHNQWVLGLHPSLRLHLRGTRGISK